jgi:hypothetical protein
MRDIRQFRSDGPVCLNSYPPRELLPQRGYGGTDGMKETDGWNSRGKPATGEGRKVWAQIEWQRY